MTLFSAITELRRPRILITAANIGMRYYKREAQLKAILQTASTPKPERALHSFVG